MTGCTFDPGARSALAFVTLRSDGECEFMFYRIPSADMLLQESKLDLGLITKASTLVSAEKAREGDLSIWEIADIINDFSGRVDGLKVEQVDTPVAHEEDQLREALKFANACGALTVTERGVIPALPTKEAVLNAILKSARV
ncbi:hypothetical protein ACFE04_008046 [Oxalis oulophora]